MDGTPDDHYHPHRPNPSHRRSHPLAPKQPHPPIQNLRTSRHRKNPHRPPHRQPLRPRKNRLPHPHRKSRTSPTTKKLPSTNHPLSHLHPRRTTQNPNPRPPRPPQPATH